MLYKCKKMFTGRTSVRDYLVKYCRKMKEELIIEFEGKQMKVRDLDKYYCDNIPHHAQHSDKFIKKGDVYYLWDYLFEPNIEINPAENWEMDGLKKMLLAWKNLKKPKQMKVGDIK